jgi:tetratricopeptide (TPR) repeat protein
MSRPHSAAAGAPRKQRVLANQAPRRSANSFRSPAATKAAEASRQDASRSAEAKSLALQRVAAQRRTEVNPLEEDAIRAFTRNADPTSLRVLQLIQQADGVPQSNPAEKLRVLRQCYPLLEEVPKERFDQLAVTVYQQEGDIYYQQMDIQNAKDTFSRAITLAEKRVARQDTDMYMVLKRYVLAMIGMARIWYDHERDHQGFRFVDHKHPKVPAADGNNSDDGNSSLSSLESSLSSDGGSVFSLNEAILRSMAPRPPRRQTGPLFKRLKLKAPHTLKNAQYDREDEFVLHSRMTRELVASPCELLLLRCCEVVQIGHNAQSELLIPPQIELAQIYEDLALYSRALLLVRRCLGILCSVYDYDHPWVIQLMQRADRLKALHDEQLRNEMATKIQATWKMHKAMQALADALGHPVKRHQWIPRKYRTTPDLDYLGDFVGDLPEDQPLGEESVPPTEGDDNMADPRTWQVVPQPAPVPEAPLSSDRPRRDTSYDSAESQPPYPGAELQPPYPGALVRYTPTEHREGGDTFTTMVSNANVVGTTQDTQTDTNVQHTDFGDLLTVRTTTVTKTITEDLAHSDDNDEEDEEEEEEEPEEDYEDVDFSGPHEVPPSPPPPPQQQQPRREPERHHLPPSHDDSPYADDEDVYPEEAEEEEELPQAYDDDEEEQAVPVDDSPRDTSTEAQRPHRSRPHRPMPPSQEEGRRRRDPPQQQQQREYPTSAPRRAPKSSLPPPPPAPAKPQQRAKQTQVQPRGHAAATQTRSSPPPLPPPSQKRQDQRPLPYSEASVSSSTVEVAAAPPRPVHKTKQTQVQPRGHAAGTQTRASPRPPPSPPQSSTPPPPTAPPQESQQRPARRPSPLQQAAPPPLPMQPRRTTSGTQYDVQSDAGSEVQHPPPRPQRQQQPQQRLPQRRPPSELDDEDGSAREASDEPGDDYVSRAAPQRRQPSPSAPAKPYNPDVIHNSKREPFRDLVEPNEAYPLDTNGAPLFLPPLPYRAVPALNRTPQHPLVNAANGQLVVRDPSRNGALQPVGVPRTGAMMQLYDPRKIDVNAQPGMPMSLPSPANGYPRNRQNTPLPPSQPKKITRDHKIIKTRIVRTYRRGGTSDSDDGTMEDSEDEQVYEHESGSSWETSASVSWEASRSSSSGNSGSVKASTDSDEEEASTAAATTPREHRGAHAKKSSPTRGRMVIKRPKEVGSDSSNAVATHNGAKEKNISPKRNEVADADAVKSEIINSSVQHHIKHTRHSKTTTTVRHRDDMSEL